MSERTDWYCRRCEELVNHAHWHDAAHGIEGTHMDGTERFICNDCGLITFARDEGANHFIFRLDKPMK